MKKEIRKAVADTRDALRKAITASLKLEKAVGIGPHSVEDDPHEILNHNIWFDIVGVWVKDDKPKGRRYKVSLAISNRDGNSWVYLSDPLDKNFTDSVNTVYFKANYHRIDTYLFTKKKKR